MTTTQTPKIVGEHALTIAGHIYYSPIARLSTGRVILAGKHSYCSTINEDGTEIAHSDYVPMTHAEQDEAWQACAAHGHLRRHEKVSA